MYDVEIRRVEDNIARIMVRKHLRELLDSGAPEDDLIRRFHAARQTYPDESYRSLARRVWTDYVIDVETLQQLQRQRAERQARRTHV